MSELNGHDILKFKKGFRLHYDKVRSQWYIQAPERAYEANPIAVEILRHVDGQHRCSDIIDLLSQQFDAPRERIAADAYALLAILRDKHILDLT